MASNFTLSTVSRAVLTNETSFGGLPLEVTGTNDPSTAQIFRKAAMFSFIKGSNIDLSVISLRCWASSKSSTSDLTHSLSIIDKCPSLDALSFGSLPDGLEYGIVYTLVILLCDNSGFKLISLNRNNK